jgi:hypothetical protein
MGKITFVRGGGGLGRQQPGEDYISGLIFSQTALPSGFGSSDRIKKVTTLAEAEALGIVETHSDETVATGGNILISAAGAAGDVWTVTITPAGGSAITLCTYTEVTADTTVTIATGIFNAINLETVNHGFTSTNAVPSSALIIAPAKYGVSLNAAGLVSASSGAGTDTETQFTSGVGSEVAINHYHVSEFFAEAENISGLAQGILYIGIYASYDGTQIGLVQDFASGDIRQMGVFLPDTFASSQVTASQTGATAVETDDNPLSVLLGADFSATTLAALADMRALDSKNVSVVIGEDKGGEGGRMVGVNGFSMTCLGAALGSAANASVHENIGWRNKFDQIHSRSASVVVQTTPFNEYDTLQFATGEAWDVQSAVTLTTLTNQGYIYLTKETGVTGSFYSDDPTATLVTSDFAYLANNRTIDKAVRLVRENLINKINSPLYVDASTGKLSTGTIEDFKNDAFKALENMATNAEINTNPDGELPANSVLIDPDQDVVTTSTITLTIQIVPVGVARLITVNIGFAVSIS